MTPFRPEEVHALAVVHHGAPERGLGYRGADGDHGVARSTLASLLERDLVELLPEDIWVITEEGVRRLADALVAVALQGPAVASVTPPDPGTTIGLLKDMLLKSRPMRLWCVDDGHRHYAAAPTIREALTVYDVPEEVDDVAVTEMGEEKARRVKVGRADEGLPPCSLWELFLRATEPGLLSSEVS